MTAALCLHCDAPTRTKMSKRLSQGRGGGEEGMGAEGRRVMERGEAEKMADR